MESLNVLPLALARKIRPNEMPLSISVLSDFCLFSSFFNKIKMTRSRREKWASFSLKLQSFKQKGVLLMWQDTLVPGDTNTLFRHDITSRFSLFRLLCYCYCSRDSSCILKNARKHLKILSILYAIFILHVKNPAQHSEFCLHVICSNWT